MTYLRPRLAVLSLCDPGLEDEERKAIARELLKQPREEITNVKPEVPTLGWDGDNIKHPPISSFITPESWLLFNLLQIEISDWLEVLCNLPCSMWDKVQEYIKVEVYVTNLSCVALINYKVKTNKPGGEQKLLDLL